MAHSRFGRTSKLNDSISDLGVKSLSAKKENGLWIAEVHADVNGRLVASIFASDSCGLAIAKCIREIEDARAGRVPAMQ